MAKPIVLPLVGDNAAFDRSMAKSAGAATSAADTIARSYKGAASAAAAAAKEMGASVDVQVASAAKASVAWTESYGKMSTSARNAGAAASAAARRAGESLDVQSAAYARAIKATQAYEAANAQAAVSAEESAKKSEAAAAAQAKASEAAAAAQKKAAAAGGATLAKAGKYAVGGAVIGAVVSVKGASDFQAAMEKIRTQAHASQQEVNSMSKSVLNLAGPLATSPTTLAASLYHVESAGFRGAQALNIMSLAAKAAKISGADLTDTTTALTAAVFSQIKGAQDASHAIGLLNATVGAGDMSFQNLDEALAGPMLATVKGYGLSLKDVGAALATFGDLNIRGADAATQLRMAVQYMAKPAATAGPLLEKLGLNTHSFADAMAHGGLLPALDLLNTKMRAAGVQGNQMAQVLGDMFTKRGAAGVTILENSLDKLRSKYPQVTQGANKFGADWAATQKTFAFETQQAEAVLESLADKFGTALIPKLQAAAKATENVIDWFQKNQSAAKALAAVVEGVLAAAVGAFAVTKAAAMIAALKNMGAGMTALVGTFRGGSTALVASADEAEVGVDAAIGTAGIGGGLVALGVAATELALHWQTVMGDLESAAQQIVGPIIQAFDAIINAAQSAGNIFNSKVVKNLTAGEGTGGGPTGGLNKKWFAGNSGNDTYKAPNTPGMRKAIQILDSNPATGGGVAIEQAKEKAALAKYQAAAKKALAASKVKGLSDAGLANLTGGGGSAASPSSSSSSTAAAATSAIPAAVATMLATAKSLIGTPYKWGGGHGSTFDPVDELKKIGVDCSGFVSAVLHAGGVNLPGPQTTAGLAQDLKPGAGKDVTVYDRPNGSEAHTIISILGKYFESGGNSAYNPRGGVSPLTQAQAAGELAGGGFEKFHPVYPGALASDKTLSKLGVSKTAGQSAGESLEQAVAKFKQAIAATGNALIQRYGSATQSGSVGGLDSALGGRPKPGSSFADLMVGERGTPQDKAFQAQELALQQTGQTQLADKLGIAHTEAMERLSNKLIAIQTAAAAKRLAAITKPADASLTKLGNVTQTGSISGLERDLGVHTGRNQSPTFGAVMKGESGSGQQKVFESQVEALVKAGQMTLATKLVTAHTQAMEALSREMVAKQEQANSESLTLQATKLQDQTTAIQDAAAGQLTAMKDAEQKVNDLAQAGIEHMQNMQTATDDAMAAMATATKDQATVNSDLGQANIDSINDTFQTSIDTLGEKGLYGLNLLAQQQQVEADQVKAYWDQQIDLMQLQLDKDQQAADAAEAVAKLNADNVTTQQQMLVATAQTKLDNVTANQDARITRAQAHADAVQAHVDAAQVGPAQIAVDMNANASKSVQDIFNAQLNKATAAGSVTVNNANQTLANVTGNADSLIQGAQDNYDSVNNTASLTIEQAAEALSNLTDQWNNILAGDQFNLSSTQTAGTTAEATATGTAGVTGAQANTQYAGTGGQTIIVNGFNMTDPTQTASEIGWMLSTKVPA